MTVGRKPDIIKSAERAAEEAREKENAVEQASREFAEDMALLANEPELVEEIQKTTNFSPAEMTWITENAKALAEGKRIESDPYNKHRVKLRMMANSFDSLRFITVSSLFYDDLEEIIPRWTAYNLIKFWVAKDGIEGAYEFSGAIEMGMKEYLQATGDELSEVSIPIQIRLPAEKQEKAVTKILGKAYEKFLEKVKEKENKNLVSPRSGVKGPEEVSRIRAEKAQQMRTDSLKKNQDKQ
jgi:hypothetical protein